MKALARRWHRRRRKNSRHPQPSSKEAASTGLREYYVCTALSFIASVSNLTHSTYLTYLTPLFHHCDLDAAFANETTAVTVSPAVLSGSVAPFAEIKFAPSNAKPICRGIGTGKSTHTAASRGKWVGRRAYCSAISSP